MAESSALVTDLQEVVSCSLCLENYDSPRMLPCGHSFCKNCLDQHIRASAEKDPRLRMFQCPMCRTDVPVPEDGASHFPVNYTIVNMLDALSKKQDKSSTKKCDICSVHDSQHICMDCSKYMCHQCFAYHDKFYKRKNHVSYLMSEINSMSIEDICELSPEFCKIHTEDRVRFYCESCDAVICINCRVTTHHGADHVCTDVSTKNAEWRAELEKCANEFVKMEDAVSQEKSRLEQVREEALAQHDNALSELHKNRDQIVAKIKEYFDEMEALMCRISQRDQEAVEKGISDLQNKITFIQTWKQTINNSVKFSRNSDLLISKRNVTSKITEINPMMTSLDPPVGLYRPKYTEGSADDNIIRALLGEIKCEGYTRTRQFTEISTEYVPHDVTITPSNEYVVGSLFGEVTVLGADGRATLTLTRPATASEWNPANVTCTDNVIIVSNHAPGFAGGGLVQYRHSGQCNGYLLSNSDYPRCVTVSDNKVIVVYDKDGEGCIDVYEHAQEKLTLVKQHSEKSLANPWFIKMNEITGDFIITHEGGVTALSAEFTPRWRCLCRNTYFGRLASPAGVAITAAGEVIIADRDSGGLLILSGQGEFIREIRMPSQGRKGLRGITLDRYGRVVVTDLAANKLYICNLLTRC